MDYRIESLRRTMSELDECIKESDHASEIMNAHVTECMECSEKKGFGFFCSQCPDRFCSMCKTYVAYEMARMRWEQRHHAMATWIYCNAHTVHEAVDCYVEELKKKPEV